MNMFIFSITNNLSDFHRKPEIFELSKKLGRTGGKVFYFKKPAFLLSKNAFTKEKQIDRNISILKVFTLLPLSIAIKNNLLLQLFVTYPIKLQLFFIKKFFKLSNKNLYYWIYKPDQYCYLVNKKNKYIYLHYDNYENDTNYFFSSFKTFHTTLKKCIDDSFISLCTSSKLTRKLNSIPSTKKVIYYPNAIARELLTDVVSDIANKVPNQITVGFVGQLDNSFNYELLDKLLSHYKNFNFVLVGKFRDNKIKQLESKYQNLRLTGFIPYTELPKVIADFDIGICPYSENSFNQYRNPLKVYEYFSYGLPVVCSDCDVDLGAQKLLSMSKSDAEFIENISKEIATNSARKSKQRIEFAAKNCWDNRIEFITEKLNET